MFVLIQYPQLLLTIEELSIIYEIDGGQFTLELYLFGSSDHHSSSRWFDDHIAQTPNFHHLPSRSNAKRLRRNDKSYLLHPCTKTHCHGHDVLSISSTRQSRVPSHHATVVISLTGRNSYRNATQHGKNLRPTYKVVLFCYWQHHGISPKYSL